jgi:hypothetical protein
MFLNRPLESHQLVMVDLVLCEEMQIYKLTVQLIVETLSLQVEVFWVVMPHAAVITTQRTST